MVGPITQVGFNDGPMGTPGNCPFSLEAQTLNTMGDVTHDLSSYNQA